MYETKRAYYGTLGLRRCSVRMERSGPCTLGLRDAICEWYKVDCVPLACEDEMYGTKWPSTLGFQR